MLGYFSLWKRCVPSYIPIFCTYNIVFCKRKDLQSSGYKSFGSISGPGFDSPWEWIFLNLINDVMLSVVGNVPSIARRQWWLHQSRGFAGSIYEDTHRSRVCVHTFIGVWVCVYYGCLSCALQSKKIIIFCTFGLHLYSAIYNRVVIRIYHLEVVGFIRAPMGCFQLLL